MNTNEMQQLVDKLTFEQSKRLLEILLLTMRNEDSMPIIAASFESYELEEIAEMKE